MENEETASYTITTDDGAEFEVTVPKDTPMAEVNQYVESELGGGNNEGFDQSVHASPTTTSEEFAYGKSKGEASGGLLDKGIDILTQHFPLTGRVVDHTLNQISEAFDPTGPRFKPKEGWGKDRMWGGWLKYKSPNEKYGEGFDTATPDVRREMILAEKAKQLALLHPGYKPTGSAAETAGEIWGSIKDPTSLIPVGASWKAMIGIGGALGGTYSVADDLQKTGDVDLGKAGLFTAGGAAAGPLLKGAFWGGGKAVKGISTLVTNKTSEKTVNKAQAVIAKKQSLGEVVTESNLDEVAAEVGVSSNRLVDSFKSQGVQPKFYSSVDEAEKALQAAIADDSAVLRTVSKNADHVLGVMSTRVKNISEEVFGRLMDYEHKITSRTANYMDRTEGFMRGVKALPKKSQEELNYYLGTGQFKVAENWMKARSPDLLSAFNSGVKPVLVELREELIKNGHKADIEQYFPRSVLDHKSLNKALTDETKTILDEALEAGAKSRGKQKADLTSFEKDRITERVLLNNNFREKGKKALSHLKKRKVGLNTDLMKHYKNPAEALQGYISSSVNHLERKRFFRDTFVKNSKDESGIDVLQSISNGKHTGLVDELVKAKQISPEKADELTNVLRARFVNADKQMHSGVAAAKNLGYIGTLGDFMSAMTQIADTPNIIGYHGFKHTLKAAFGAKHFKTKDVGLHDTVARELTEGGKFTKTLDKLLSVTQFKRIDRFGKETLMNTVRNKHMKNLSESQGVDNFKKEWGKIYQDKTDELINDLQQGNKTELTKLHMFTELSGHQPISMSEYPALYANSPNGRALYMLKSFTIKQYDLVRRNIWNEYKKAETTRQKLKVMQKAGKVAFFMSASGYGVDRAKDWVLGREIKPEDIGTDAIVALASAYGLTKFAASKHLKNLDFVGLADSTILSFPMPVVQGIQSLLAGDVAKASRHVPVVGRALHSHVFGGKEKFNKRKW